MIFEVLTLSVHAPADNPLGFVYVETLNTTYVIIDKFSERLSATNSEPTESFLALR